MIALDFREMLYEVEKYIIDYAIDKNVAIIDYSEMTKNFIKIMEATRK